MKERHLFLLQRLSAMLLAPLVISHLILIMIAVRNGLSAEEILNRTQGNYFWGGFYVVFVLNVSIHAPIGMRNVLREWTKIPKARVNHICIFLAIIFLALGIRAVVAVI